MSRSRWVLYQRDHCKHIVTVQVLPLLSHPNDAITNEVLSLLKALLFSGNEVVQEGLQDFVKDTREEYLFANLKKKLDNAAECYKERYGTSLSNCLYSRLQ